MTIFKETEIGLIPKEWEYIEFGSVINGGTRNGVYKSKEFHGTGVKIINMGELFAHPRLFSVPMKRVELTNKELELSSVEKGDLLFARRSLVAEGAGKCSIVCEVDEPTTFESSIIRARPNPEIVDSSFLYYFFNSKYGEYLLDTIRRQVAVAGITGSDLVKLNIPVPPLNEQIKIAEFLENLDQKIHLNIQMNQTLEAIGQALFRHWFVHYEFPNEEGRSYKSSGGEMVDTELGEIPAGWEVQEIGNTIETTGGGTPSTKKEEYWENGEIQWFSPRDITANNQMFITDSEKKINDLGLKNSSARLFPPYSLMMTSRATVGELSINTTKACTNQGFITCISNEKLSIYYLYFWIKMNKENIISLASGSTFREINKSTFRGLKIIIPDNEVLSKYNSLLRPIFNQIETLQSQNKELSQIRDSLLPKLMSGKVRVNKMAMEV